MEDGLRDVSGRSFSYLNPESLNPCFNGRWSASQKENLCNAILQKES